MTDTCSNYDDDNDSYDNNDEVYADQWRIDSGENMVILCGKIAWRHWCFLNYLNNDNRRHQQVFIRNFNIKKNNQHQYNTASLDTIHNSFLQEKTKSYL